MDSHDLDKKDVRRPMNAFLIFCKRHRTMVREKNPNLDNRSVTRILGDLWANLKEDEKSQYTDLAKQYKDAFMRANPDYKWHNPDKLGTAVPLIKPSTRPSNVRPGGREDECHVEGSIVSGKLADPSNMGGLSLLLMAGQQSSNKQSSNPARVTSPTSTSHGSGSLLELAEMCSTKLQHNGQNLVEGSRNDHISDNGNQLLDLTKKKLPPELDSNNQSGAVSVSHDFKSNSGLDKERLSSQPIKEVGLDLSHKKSIKCQGKGQGQESVDILSKEQLPDLNESLMNSVKSSQKGKGALSEDFEEENCHTALEDTESGKTEEEDENAILTCGKVMMDHIIEKLFSSELGPKKGKQKLPCSDEQLDVKGGSCATQVASPSDLSKSSCDKICNAQNSSVAEIVKEKNGDQLKLPSLPLKMSIKEEFLKGDNFRSRKRCYSEPCGDHYENHLPPKKLQRMFIGFTLAADSSDQSGAQGQGSRSGDSENADDATGDDEYQPVRKSKRRNRGQRYQELINEGIIQPSKERMAAIKGETTVTCKQEESNSDEEPSCKKEELAFDVLSVYPRQIRKRTCSESEKTRAQHEEIKRYKTGDFDLEAHIATLPACSLEKVTRANKRIVGKPRSMSESSGPVKLPSVDEAPVEVVLSVPPHLKCLEKPVGNEPVVGSRKRKARKHSITHLKLLPPNPTGINRVNDKAEERSDSTIPIQKSEYNSRDIVKSLSNARPTITEINRDRCLTLSASTDENLKIANKCSDQLPQSVRKVCIGDTQTEVKFPISNDLDLRMAKNSLDVDKKEKNIEANVSGDHQESFVADKGLSRLSENGCASNSSVHVKKEPEALSKGNNSVALAPEPPVSATSKTLAKKELKHIRENNEISCKLKHSDKLTDVSAVNYDDQNVVHSVDKSDNVIEAKRAENLQNCDKVDISVSSADQGGTSALAVDYGSSSAVEKISVPHDQIMKSRNIAECEGCQHQEEVKDGSTASDKVCVNNETGGQVRKSTLEKLRRTLKGDNSLTKECTTKLCDNVAEKKKWNENIATAKSEEKDSVESVSRLCEDTRGKDGNENKMDNILCNRNPSLSSYYNNNNSSKILASILSKKAAEEKEIVDDNDSNTSSKILASILSKDKVETTEVVQTSESVVTKSELNTETKPKALDSTDMLKVKDCTKESDRMVPVSSESEESNEDLDHSLENLLATTGSVSSSPIPMTAVKS